MSSTSPINPYYIDLFDDGLYPLEATANSHDLEKNAHINLLRLHVLLAILFERTIVVPEQWATSSASFLYVAHEVLENYKDEARAKDDEHESTRFIRFPFCVYFIKRKTERYHPGIIYLAALAERAAQGRRVQLSPKLVGSQEGDEPRRQFREACGTAVAASHFDDSTIHRLRGQLQRALGDGACAAWISTLSQRLYQWQDEAVIIDFETSFAERYRDELEVQTRAIAATLLGPGGNEQVLADPRIQEFRQFLVDAKRDNIELHSIMDLWQRSQTRCSENVQHLIAATGRYAMHRAMARATNADHADSCFSYYFRKTDGGVLKDEICMATESPIVGFFDELRRTETRSHARQDRDFRIQVRSEQGRRLEPRSWVCAWERLWDYLVSDEWKRQRAKREEALAKAHGDTRTQAEIWGEILEDLPLRGDLPFAVQRVGDEFVAKTTDPEQSAEVRRPIESLLRGSRLRGRDESGSAEQDGLDPARQLSLFD